MILYITFHQIGDESRLTGTFLSREAADRYPGPRGYEGSEKTVVRYAPVREVPGPDRVLIGSGPSGFKFGPFDTMEAAKRCPGDIITEYAPINTVASKDNGGWRDCGFRDVDVPALIQAADGVRDNWDCGGDEWWRALEGMCHAIGRPAPSNIYSAKNNWPMGDAACGVDHRKRGAILEILDRMRQRVMDGELDGKFMVGVDLIAWNSPDEKHTLIHGSTCIPSKWLEEKRAEYVGPTKKDCENFNPFAWPTVE